MQKLFIVLLIIAFSKPTFAQEEGISGKNYELIYSTIFNFSFDRGQNFQKLTSRLLVCDSISSFTTLVKADQLADTDERNIILSIDTLFSITKFFAKNEVHFSERGFSQKPIIYADTLHPMNWEFTSNKKMIDSLECHMATTFFKGRYYIAWYCPSLALPNGPWKLGGLPGLIVEAYDESKELYFVLNSFAVTKAAIRFPTYYPVPSYAQFISNGHKFIKKLREQMSAQSANCVDCQSDSKIEFYTWERVFNQ